jgi:hypothetical protein
LRRRKIERGRHHERSALTILDALLASQEPHFLHEAPKQLGIEWHVLIILSPSAARAGNQCERQYAGKRGGALPFRVSVSHSYPLHITA